MTAMRELQRVDVEDSSSALLLRWPTDSSSSAERSDNVCSRHRLGMVRIVAASGAFLLGVCGAALLSAGQTSELRPTPSMSAVEVPEGHHIVSVSKELCLTRSDENSGSLITSAFCAINDQHQKWVFNGDLGHITTPSGKCLDDGGDFVHIWDCRDDDDHIKANQRWIFSRDKYIKNSKGLCLHASINGGKVGFISCSNTADMHWRLSLAPPEPEEPQVQPEPEVQPTEPEVQPTAPTTPFPTQKPVEGQILLKQHGYCLDSGGEALHLWDCADATPSQVWQQDKYTMQLRSHNGRCLDASSHTLELACDPSSEMQIWNLDAETGHIYTMAAGGHCLATTRPLHHGDIVGLKECDEFVGNELKWTIDVPTEEHAEEPDGHSDGHLDKIVVAAVPVLTLLLILFFILLNMRRKSKAEPTIVQPRSEPEEDVEPLSDPNLHGVKMADPRPSTNRHLQVSVLAFGFEGKDPCDELCSVPWLSNGYHLGPEGVQVEAYGVTKGFCNSEAAFQALKFWPVAAEFAGLSAEQALEKKQSLSGREDFDYGSYGSKWRGMQAVLNAKFRTGSQLDKMLGKTGDAFLLYHTNQKGSDQLWSDDSDGDGTNWLGMQLMLLREKRSGWKRWTSFIESCVSTSTGEVSAENSTWQEAVRAARRALEEVLAAQQSQQQFEELRQERERRSEMEQVEDNGGAGEEEGG